MIAQEIETQLQRKYPCQSQEEGGIIDPLTEVTGKT